MRANNILLYLVLLVGSLVVNKAFGQVKDDSLIAVASPFPPFQYVEEGILKGISIDVLSAIIQKTELIIEYRVMPWKRAYNYTLSRPNTVIMAISRTSEREPLFKWVGPLYNTQIKMYRLTSRRDIVLYRLADAMQFRIGTVRGYASERYLLTQGFKKNIQIISDSTTTYNVKKLLNDRIDLLVSTDLTLSYLIKNENINPDTIVEAFKLSDPIPDFFGFNLNTSDEIINEFQRVFDELVESGDYQKIINNYLLRF
ncbi:substrate-binding periplasmic protein [Zooshikella sp. RANM57]|uniref:substrate-binding periplasmic protein n=1 Tax=Zooshikella sp. RANM57 TaxID=3425863 RepID=UPI003D6DDD85